QPLDFRSDQFSFGSILYEMATGKRAFQKGTAVDTLSAILHEEPKAIGEISPDAPAPLRWAIERCLAKEPENRYAATRDLARDFATMRDRVSEAISGPTSTAPPRGGRRLVRASLAVATTAAVVGALLVGRQLSKAPLLPRFQQLTFRDGHVGSARFTSD